MIVFDSKSVLVTSVRRNTSEIFVTFTNLFSGRIPSSGFGEEFFTKEGISTLAFIGKSNHWWQTKDMAEAVVKAGRFLDQEGYRRRVAYGSSMGAFGAIVFATDLGVDLVLAMSPQFSVDPTIVPFERRYTKYSKQITQYIHPFDSAKLSKTLQVCIFYDPLNPDHLHQEKFPDTAQFKRICLPFGGHPLLPLVQEMRLLRPLILGSLVEMPNLVAFRNLVRKERGGSSRYFENASKYLFFKKHYELGEKLGRRALAINQNLLDANRMLGLCLHYQRKSEGALEQAVRVCLLNPQGIHDRRHLGSLLLSAERLPEAIAEFAKVLQILPHFVPAELEFARALMMLSLHDAAVALVKTCIEKEPENRRALSLLAELQASAEAIHSE